MNIKRGFEIAKGFENCHINLPIRKTKNAAAYDVEASENIKIPVFEFGSKPTLIKTGLKVYMQPDEYLMIVNRSSGPKKGLIMANGIGIIDADYYGNPDNDGAFMFPFYNFKGEELEIKKGDCIGQVIFQKYYLADNDEADGDRTGGFGSTDK